MPDCGRCGKARCLTNDQRLVHILELFAVVRQVGRRWPGTLPVRLSAHSAQSGVALPIARHAYLLPVPVEVRPHDGAALATSSAFSASNEPLGLA